MDTREAITRLVFIADTPGAADIAMVLGSLSITSMDPAIDLFRDGLVGKILISGGGSMETNEQEWRVYERYALNEGIPSSAIIVETQARNTRENFVFSEALIAREIGWSNIKAMALVTSPVHSRRALMTACRYFPHHVKLTVLCSSDEQCIQADRWWKTRYGRQTVLDEVRRIGEYALKGHIGGY